MQDICYCDFDDYNNSKIIEEDKGENHRWTRTNDVYLLIQNRYFRCSYEEGLTECQENMYYEYPIEMNPPEVKEIIVIKTIWTEK